MHQYVQIKISRIRNRFKIREILCGPWVLSLKFLKSPNWKLGRRHNFDKSRLISTLHVLMVLWAWEGHIIHIYSSFKSHKRAEKAKYMRVDKPNWCSIGKTLANHASVFRSKIQKLEPGNFRRSTALGSQFFPECENMNPATEGQINE